MHLISLAVLFVESPPEKYDNAFAKLEKYLSRLKFVRIIYYRINNKDEGTGLISKESNIYYLRGDNSEREFSGWQKGVSFLRENNIKHDVALIVNSAFEAPGTSFLKDYSTTFLFLRTILFKCAIGRIDTHGLDTTLDGFSTKKWICSNCLILPFKALMSLDNLVTIDSNKLSNYLPEEYNNSSDPFAYDAPINKLYKDFIYNWLTQKWHSKIELNEATWPIFREKVKSIFNEALLSARLRNLGYRLISYGRKKYY